MSVNAGLRRAGHRPALGLRSPLGEERRADGDGCGTAAQHAEAGSASGRQNKDRDLARAPAGGNALWAHASPARTGVAQAASGSYRRAMSSANRLSAILSGADFTACRANARGPAACFRAFSEGAERCR